MLEELHIRGLGVIEDAVLPLGPGLTVVTGETGAGKTMVVTGLLLLFGGRADSARVRTGSDQASVEGRIDLGGAGHPSTDGPRSVAERVRDAGGELDDDTGLVLRRVVGANGRSRAYVGGAAAPVSVLGELSERLLAVHGQSDQLRLTRPGAQRAALDRFAGLDLTEYAQAYERWRAAAARLAERTARMGELRREADLLAHGIAEIEAAEPVAGEDAELTALAARLSHADALRLAARTAHDALLGDADDPAGDAADVGGLIGIARRALQQQAGADPELDALGARLTDLAALATDVGAELGAYAEQLDADPARLEQVEARRSVLTALIRKYGTGPDDDLTAVLAWADQARTRLADLDVSDEAIAALTAERDAAAARVAELAAALTAARTAAAARLGAAVSAELAGLAMAAASVGVEVRPRAATSGAPSLVVEGREVAVGPEGVDEVELLLRPHQDAPALPIGRGASGGELSRVMLALEVCLAGTDPVPTMVFDEVDAGVGGRAAVEVGRRLARLARDHQVLVVTHLPQVAAFADQHVVVDKPTDDPASAERSVLASDVRLVSGDGRVAELARMLAGSDSDTAREHAHELLATARAEVQSWADNRTPQVGSTTPRRAPRATTNGAKRAQRPETAAGQGARKQEEGDGPAVRRTRRAAGKTLT